MNRRHGSWYYIVYTISVIALIIIGLRECSGASKPSGTTTIKKTSGNVKVVDDTSADEDSPEKTTENEADQEEKPFAIEDQSVKAFVDAFDQTSSGPIENLRQDDSPSSYIGTSRGHEVTLYGSDGHIYVSLRLHGDVGGVKWLMQDVFLVLDPEHAEEAASLISRTATDAYKLTEDVDTQVGKCKVYINLNMLSGRIAIDSVGISCDDFR